MEKIQKEALIIPQETHRHYAGNESTPWSEWEDDVAFTEEYKNPGTMLDAVSRLKIVKDLRFLGEGDSDESEKRRMVNLEYREAHPLPHGVTLVIEIEIPKEAIFLGEDVEWNKKQKKQFAFEMKEKYAVTQKLGVPAGKDQFWEFAHLPVQNPETLAREVQALIGMGLINAKYDKFPLHVTVGGLSFSKKEDGDDTHALARILDATGWTTTGDRLTAPYVDFDSDWTSHNCESGLRERGEEKIIQPTDGGMTTAVEFRTPIVRSLFGFDRYLHSMYYLSSSLRAYQEQKKDDKTGKQLAKVWRTFAGKCEVCFEEIGLISPFELWELDKNNPDEHTPFKDLAKILDKAEKDSKSKESKFIHDIRLLVISARAEAKEIMESEK